MQQPLAEQRENRDATAEHQPPPAAMEGGIGQFPPSGGFQHVGQVSHCGSTPVANAV